jgi:hypothetical protein
MIAAGVNRIGSLLAALSTHRRIGAEAQHLGPKEEPPAPFDERAPELAAAAAKGRPLVAGSVQLVGLSELRKAMGTGWERLKTLAPAVAEAVIKRRLTSSDTYARRDEETFILCFAEHDQARAEACARRIVEDIKAALARAGPELGEINVEQFVAEIVPPHGDEFDLPLIEAFANAIRRVKFEAEQQAREWRQRLLRDAFVLYSPLFEPEKRMATLFRCLVDEQTGRSALLRLSAVASEAALREAIFDLDCLIVARSTEGFHVVVQNGGAARLLIPVNWHTLADERFRASYIGLCTDIPDAYRQHILFELHGAPSGAAGGRILELANELGRLAAGGVVEAHPSLGPLDELAGTGLYGVSLNAAGWGAGANDVAARLVRGTAIARARNLRTIVHGAETMGVIDAATRARVDFVGGKALSPAATEPRLGTPYPAVL